MLHRLAAFLAPVEGSVRNKINRFEAARVAVLGGSTGGVSGVFAVLVALVLHLFGVPVTAGQVTLLFGLVSSAVGAIVALVDAARRTFLHEDAPAATLPFAPAR